MDDSDSEEGEIHPWDVTEPGENNSELLRSLQLNLRWGKVLWEDRECTVIDLKPFSEKNGQLLFYWHSTRTSELLSLDNLLDEESKGYNHIVFICNFDFYEKLFKKEIGLNSYYKLKAYKDVVLLLSKFPHTKFSALEFFDLECSGRFYRLFQVIGKFEKLKRRYFNVMQVKSNSKSMIYSKNVDSALLVHKIFEKKDCLRVIDI